MKKPKKKRQRPKAKTSQPVELKERFEAEFAQALKSARTYVENPRALEALVNDAAREAATMPREPFGETWPYFQAMLRLTRAYSRGVYREVGDSTLVVIIAAIIYVVNPLDVIPDALSALGYLDDATVIALAVRRSRQRLDDFMIWETTGQ